MIEPDIDRYGSLARDSALADFLELQALADGSSLAVSELADYIDDSDWRVRTHSMITGPFDTYDVEDPWDQTEGIESQEDVARQYADEIFRMVSDRARILDTAYPFELSEGRLRLRTGVEETPYTLLLAVTASHAWKLDTHVNPKIVFEDFVVRSLRAFGLRTASLGEARRSGSFEARLVELGQEIGLKPHPEAAFRSRYANDERVDVVGHLAFQDDRPGRWVLIGQATCGASDTWYHKFREPAPNKWQSLLGTLVHPIPFLAVPHHVPDPTLTRLVEEADGVLVDRMRLAALGAELTADESQLVATLKHTPVMAA